MPKYFYKALNQQRKLEEGLISARSKKSAEKTLKRGGFNVIFIARNETGAFQKDLSIPFLSGFAKTEKVNFFRNLYVMGSAGMPIGETLDVLSDQVKRGRIKRAVKTIAGDVQNGQKISIAMARFPKYFSAHLVETINVGEMSGKLSETFHCIAIDLERDEELRRKVVGALIYPVIVLFMMMIVGAALLFSILPTIESLFLELDAPLPFATKILLNLNKFLTANVFAVAGTTIGAVLLFFFSLKIKKVRYAAHYLTLRIPIFGGLIKEYNLVIFFRSLKSLVSAGISMVSAVEIAKKTVKNDVYRKALNSLQPVILYGISFSDAILPFPSLFSPQTRKIIKIGEKTGKFEETVEHVTDYYRRSIDYRTRNLTVMLEPILMVILGIVVGGLAISIFLPLYQVGNAIK